MAKTNEEAGPAVREFIGRVQSLANQAERDWSSPPTHRVGDCDSHKHYRPLAEQKTLSTELEGLADAALVELSAGGWHGRNAEERTQGLLVACRRVLGWIPVQYRIRNYSPADMQAAPETDRLQQVALLDGMRQAATALRRAGCSAAAKQAGPAAPPAAPAPTATADNPFRVLEQFAWQVYQEEQKRDIACNGRPRLDGETVAHLRDREIRLRQLGDAAMAAAHRTGFPIPEVEARVKKLEDACVRVLLWVRDAPHPTPEQQRRMEATDTWENPAGAYLIEQLNRLGDEIAPVRRLAACFDGRIDEPRPEGVRTLADLLGELERREQIGQTATNDLDQWPGVRGLRALALAWWKTLLTPASVKRFRFEFCWMLGQSIDQGNHTQLIDVATTLLARRNTPPPYTPSATELDSEECLRAQQMVQEAFPAPPAAIAGEPSPPLLIGVHGHTLPGIVAAPIAAAPPVPPRPAAPARSALAGEGTAAAAEEMPAKGAASSPPSSALRQAAQALADAVTPQALAGELTARRPLKEPSKNAIAVYRYRLLTGKTQTELAEDRKLMEQLGRAVDQGTISRWLKQVKEWIEVGNVLPNLSEPQRSKPTPIDPNRIDLGERQDGRAKRQRSRRTSDRED